MCSTPPPATCSRIKAILGPERNSWVSEADHLAIRYCAGRWLCVIQPRPPVPASSDGKFLTVRNGVSIVRPPPHHGCLVDALSSPTCTMPC